MAEKIKQDIHWFPGHMTKARRMMADSVKLVDAVCEIVDARIPAASRIPDLNEVVGNKPRLMILNRVDQADPAVTAQWREYFRKNGMYVLETDAKSGRGVNNFPSAVRTVLKEKLEAYAARGQATRPLRVMIVGVPNVGKSTFINKVARRKAAIASDRPGVTRGKQWITIDNGLELMDTPGILWPKLGDQAIGEALAWTGAVKDEIMDRETLAANLLVQLWDTYPESVKARYRIDGADAENAYALLESAAKNRGFLVSRGEYDLERMAAVLLDEFRGGKLGRISLERPESV